VLEFDEPKKGEFDEPKKGEVVEVLAGFISRENSNVNIVFVP
jgi:hypothetical protein